MSLKHDACHTFTASNISKSHQKVSKRVPKTFKKLPLGKKSRVQNKTQKRHVSCRPPGAKMLHVGVHFAKSLPKVPPRLPKGSKKIPKSDQQAIQKASQNDS